jgi:hypothetical protein
MAGVIFFFFFFFLTERSRREREGLSMGGGKHGKILCGTYSTNKFDF